MGEPLTPEYLAELRRDWLGDGRHECRNEPNGCGNFSRSCEVADVQSLLDTIDAQAAPVIDAAHLAHQRWWSMETFGPGPRTLGVIDHIRKELGEIEDDPADLDEWVDVITLAFDGAWRAGWEPQQIIDAVKAKQARNEARTWPDWRQCSPDAAIEHHRSGLVSGQEKDDA